MTDTQLRNYDRRLERTYEKAKVNLSQENFSLIEKYDNEMATLGLMKSTRAKQLSIIVDISIRLGKDWKEITKDDIDKLIRTVLDEFGNNLGGETETTRDYKKSLKPFFRWFKFGSRDFREVGDPVELKSIRLKQVKDKIVREQLLTEDDHRKLLSVCTDNARDRALLDVHYEANTRPGEILSLQIKHVTQDSYGAKIAVDGKTGTRSIRLIESVPSLNSWLNVHPLRDNPDAPLWISFDKNRYGAPISLKGAQVMLAKRCRMAQISKRVNLKLFRHSGATNIAHFLSDELMKKRMGWTKTSTMPARYTHLNNEDVEKAFFREYGISGFENNKAIKVPKICNICDTSNTPDSKTCSKCGKPLHLHAIIEQ